MWASPRQRLATLRSVVSPRPIGLSERSKLLSRPLAPSSSPTSHALRRRRRCTWRSNNERPRHEAQLFSYCQETLDDVIVSAVLMVYSGSTGRTDGAEGDASGET